MEQTNTIVKEKKNLSKTQKDMIFVACLVAIPLIHYLIFYVYVNFNSILLAFQKFDPLTYRYTWCGLENFIGNPEIAGSTGLFGEFFKKIGDGGATLLGSTVKNSLIYYLFHTGIGTTATLFFSYYIFKKRAGSKFFKVILFLPSIIASIALVLMFKYFVNEALPAIVSALTAGEKTITGLTSQLSSTFATIIFYGVWVGFGQGLLLYSGAMSNISDSVMEAAEIDGAGELRQFFSIVLPLIYPTLSTFMVNAIATLFASDMHLYAFFSGGAHESCWTFGYWLLKQTRSAGTEGLAQPAAIGILLTVFTIPITFLVRWLLKKLGPTME